jgi:hypothetical protein
VAACVWDFGGDHAPISTFWRAARELDPNTGGESDLVGARAGHLVELFRSTGLEDVGGSEITASNRFDDFEMWWEPFTLGVGPAGSYASTLDPDALDAVRDRCRELLPDPPFTLTAVAWAARGVV